MDEIHLYNICYRNSTHLNIEKAHNSLDFFYVAVQRMLMKTFKKLMSFFN